MTESSGKRQVILAFAAVYLIWGSTYLAIRLVVETIPPLLSGGVRFLAAGLVLIAVARIRGAHPATKAEWRSALIAGFLMIAGGNGFLSWAQQSVPSGVAALLVATVPLWLVALAAVGPEREPPTRREICGLALGFGGLLILLGGSGAEIGLGDTTPLSAILASGSIVLASLSWAYGSIYNRRAKLASPPLYATALTMTAGGSALLVLGVSVGELSRLPEQQITTTSWLALLYLIVFGSIIAFSAYVWLLRKVRPALVGTYAFVNPVVALLLGWWLADEVLTLPVLVGSAVIVGSVVLTQGRGSRTGDKRLTTRAPASR